jgi:hypothetical protein
MAAVVNVLGRGGQRFAERAMGWNRATIRKGQLEIENGKPCENRYSSCGRKPSEHHLPNLLVDIKSLIEPHSQTDPTFRSCRIYTPLTAKEIRSRLKKEFAYKESELPGVRSLRTKLNKMGFTLKKVKKCKPIKRIPETDQIFDSVHSINQAANIDEGILRISLDTKAVVKIGEFSRGGYNRQGQNAYDHDFKPTMTTTPFGILLPQTGKSHIWFTEGSATADFMVDCIEEMLPRWKKEFGFHTLVINADNGPECSGRRTQWLKRLVDLVDQHGIKIQLAYYPPYHSKYNPIERVWGVLENHWRGEIINSLEKALGLARSMTYQGLTPSVRKSTKVYQKGVSIAKKAMIDIEKRLTRKRSLESWNIAICPQQQMG